MRNEKVAVMFEGFIGNLMPPVSLIDRQIGIKALSLLDMQRRTAVSHRAWDDTPTEAI
ncbi:MAG: hypothetical protein ACRD3T_17195 [Terriglobia bacterium]